MLHFLCNLLNLGFWKKKTDGLLFKVILEGSVNVDIFSLSPTIIKLINVVKGEGGVRQWGSLF